MPYRSFEVGGLKIKAYAVDNYYNELPNLLYQSGLIESWYGKEMLFSRFTLRRKEGEKTSFNPWQGYKRRIILFGFEVCGGKWPN